jgi:hypothetical protein
MDHRAKLDWARKHLDRLESEIQIFVDSEPYTPTFEKQEQVGRWISRIRVNRTIPSEWSLIVGDVLHNLRSALDNVVYALITNESGTPAKPAQIQFPIFGDSADFKAKREKYLAGMNPKAVAIIEGLQPFNRLDRKWHSQLTILNYLSNIDKHRHIIVTTMAGALTNVTVDAFRLVPELTNVITRKVPIVDGAVLATIYTPVAEGFPAKVTMRGDFPVDVQFGGVGLAQGASVHAVLKGIHDHIRDVVCPPLEQFLK